MNKLKKITVFIIGLEFILFFFFMIIYWMSDQKEEVFWNFKFLFPAYFFLNFLGILIGFLFVRSIRRAEVLKKYSILGREEEKISILHASIYYSLLRVCFSCLIFSAALPIKSDELKKQEENRTLNGVVTAKEIIFCLDLSNSMNVKDLTNGGNQKSKSNSSRLQSSKRVVQKIIGSLSKENIGLCVFANNAIREIESTNNYALILNKLNSLNTSYFSLEDQGTNIRDAIKKAQEMFTSSNSSKIIVVLTDGENFSPETFDYASGLNNSEYTCLFLGFGSKEGGRIPGFENDPNAFSKLDIPMLKQLANKLGGNAYIYSDEFPKLAPLLTQINQIKKEKSGNLKIQLEDNSLLNFFLWIAFLGFILLLVYPMLFKRW